MEQAFSANTIRLLPPVRKVNCTHWRDCRIAGGGGCAIGKFGGVPSYGLCTDHCTSIVHINPPHHSKEQIHAERKLLNEATSNIPAFPSYSKQRGIIYCVDELNISMGWVNISLLRDLGCTLPIEVWHLDGDFSHFEPLNVTMRKAFVDDSRELKSFALLNSDFGEALCIDSDNFPISDPTYIFEADIYATTGALFWPNIEQTTDYGVWDVFGRPPVLEPEFAGGAMVINRKRSWDAVNIAHYLSQRDDFYYEYFDGDKDTFRFAWKAVDREYSLIRRPPAISPAQCFLHFDHEEKVLFEHRAGQELKWTPTSYHCDKMMLEGRIAFFANYFTQVLNSK